VLSLVAGGLSNRQIAERLVVSEHTVHRHLANVYARLGVSSRAAALRSPPSSTCCPDRGGPSRARREDGPNGR
jgi:FixJ family two-component response regulator